MGKERELKKYKESSSRIWEDMRGLLWLKILCKDKRWLLYWVTQKNLMEFQVQNSLPYIP